MFKTLKLVVLFLGILLISFASTVFVYDKIINSNISLTKTVSLKNMPKLLIVQSGSMEPAIKTGSIILSVPANSYSQNDIITYRNGKNLVTHRIEARLYPKSVDGNPVFRTSGDANEDLDPKEVAENEIIGKVAVSIPYLGYAADFAKTPKGFILFVIVPATIIAYEELKFLLHSAGKKFKQNKIAKTIKSSHQKNKSFLKTAAVVPIFGIIAAFTGLTRSYFSDTEKVTGNVLQASIWTTTPSPTPIPTINHILISEVQITGGPGHTTDDFIELYNPTDTDFSLGENGYRLVKRTGSNTTDISIRIFTNSQVIPAHGYFLWANSGYLTIQTIPDDTTTDTLATENSIALKNSNGEVVDSLSWNSAVESYKEGVEFSPDPGAGESMERKAYSTSTEITMEGGSDSLKGNGYDSDNNSNDFILRTISDPQNSSSPTETP